MTIDLVYKIGSCETDGNFFELRQSIRSAVKHFKYLGNIYIVGHKPNWLINVKHIELNDPYTSNKDANLINKLLLACFDSEISNNFLNMSDDYFFLKDIDQSFIENIYYNNHVIETIEKKKRGEINGKLTKWERRVEMTLNTLMKNNLPTNCYETHAPQFINKYTYPETVLRYSYGEHEGMCGNTLYFNTLKVKSISLPEDFLRIESAILNIEDLNKLLENKSFLNYTVTTYNHIMSQMLRDRFTEKTRFEI